MKRAEHLQTEKGWLFYVSTALLALCFGLLFLLLTQTNIYCDDYRYATYFKDGLAGFWYNTKYHYLLSNGRAFIHVLIPIVLIFKSNLYMFLFPLILFGLFYFGIKLLGQNFNRQQTILCMTVTMLLFLGLGLGYFRTTVFWISGSFNYIFPVFFLLMVLYFFRKSLIKNKLSPIVLLLSLLAGATTEQGGAMVLFGLFFFGLSYLIKKKADFWVCILPFFLALIGYTTILLAPGTASRVAVDTQGGFFTLFQPSVFQERFYGVLSYFTGIYGNHLLPVLFPLGVGLLPFFNRAFPKPLFTGLPFALAIGGCYLFGKNMTAVVLLLVFLFAFACFFLKNDTYQALSAIAFMILISQAMMLFTIIYSYRVAVPGLLLLLLITGFIWSQILLQIRASASTCWLFVLFCYSLTLFIPMVIGCSKSNAVYRENMAQLELAKTAGEAHITVDLEDEYGFALVEGDEYYHDDFRKTYDVDSETVIYLESPSLPKLYIEGKQQTAPVLLKENRVYFPILEIMKAYGIDAEVYTDGTIVISYHSQTITLEKNRCVITNANDKVVKDFSCSLVNEFSLATEYLDAASFAEIFNVTYTYHSEGNYYEIDSASVFYHGSD